MAFKAHKEFFDAAVFLGMHSADDRVCKVKVCELFPEHAPVLFVATIVMGHVYEAYMMVGVGEVCRNLFRVGQTWQWALLCSGVALLLVFQPSYNRLEWVFKFFLGMLAISFVGSALWVGCDIKGLAQGLYRIGLPDQRGQFNPLLVAAAMIGAVGGSLMNLAYPYFLVLPEAVPAAPLKTITRQAPQKEPDPLRIIDSASRKRTA